MRRNPAGVATRKFDSPTGWNILPTKLCYGEEMGFRETLPTDGAPCPPKEAHTGLCDSAFRLIPSKNPVSADFASNRAKEELLPPGVDACRWASCSLYCDLATVIKKRKLPKLKHYLFAAELKIKAGSGFLLQGGTHIDFWMFDTFDPIKAIVQIKGL